MEHQCTGDSPGPSTIILVPSCSSTPAQVPAIPLVSTSQDYKAAFIDSSDLELSVEDAHEIETVDTSLQRAVGVSVAQGTHSALLF